MWICDCLSVDQNADPIFTLLILFCVSDVSGVIAADGDGCGHGPGGDGHHDGAQVKQEGNQAWKEENQPCYWSFTGKHIRNQNWCNI